MVLELPYGAPDPMMDELREIRREMSKVLETMRPEELIAWIHEQAQAALDGVDMELRPHPSLPRMSQITKKG